MLLSRIVDSMEQEREFNTLKENVKMLLSGRILTVVRDITGRKDADDTSRGSEDHIRLIIDTIPIMAWTILPDGTVDFVNQTWMDYAGLSLDEVMKRPTGIIHPEDLPHVMEKWLANMVTGEPSEDEMRLRRADGEYRWFLVRTAPLRNEQGNPVKWYGISTDIEDSKRAEDELRLTYQRLSYHVENSPLAVIEWDKDLFIRRWSSHAEDIFEWTASEALGKNMYDPDFLFIYEDDLQAVNEIVEQLLKGIVKSNLSLNRNYTKEGSVIYCEWYNSVLRDEQGNAITILSLIHNVTERKKAQDTLQQSYEEIRRLTGHLRTIREEERTRIAREIHDELGQQLTVLKLDVSWLTKRLNRTNPATKDRLKDLNALLDSTVQSVRRISYELRPVLLDEFGLGAAMEWHLKEFEKRSAIRTCFSQPQEEPQFDDTVKTNLFRIFQESLTNVARHSKASEVKIDVVQNAQQFMLRIQDNGIGFNKEKGTEGKTLGILGMKERAASFGWQYEINTKPGHGTTVMVTIPFVKKTPL